MTTIPLTCTLISPLHHGAGNAGNTSLLRTQDMVLPDGRAASVPYVSGNSLRHTLRAALAWHAVHTMQVPDGALSKAVVDLLWSGGAITKTGAETLLDRTRRVEQLAPWLNMMGYSAGSDMVAGTLAVNHLHLVCAENAWRLPAALDWSPHAGMGAAAYRGEEFGTRHDVTGTPVDRYVAHVSDDPPGIGASSTQMIYDMQVVRPGAVLAGSLTLDASATEAHRLILTAALQLAAPEVDGRRILRLGAKSAVGYGQTILDIPDLDPTALDWWTGHLAEHRGEILDLLDEITR